jgi:hypothetical protein
VEQESRIQLAIQAYKNSEIRSIRHAAEAFDVPYSALQDRLSGHLFQVERRNHMHRLSET